MGRQAQQHGTPRTAGMTLAAIMLAAAGWTAPTHAATSPADTQGDAATLTQIAIAHYEHNEFGRAFDEFAEAAQRGNRLAQFNYAMMLMRGEGTVAQPEAAVKWLRRAADNQMTHAQFAYGELFERGELVPRSCRKPTSGTSAPPTAGTSRHSVRWRPTTSPAGACRAITAVPSPGTGKQRKPATDRRNTSSAATTSAASPAWWRRTSNRPSSGTAVPRPRATPGHWAKLRELVERTYRAKHGDPPAAARPSM